jgi:hypothetical protein
MKTKQSGTTRAALTRNRRGVALIMVLGLVTMLAILVMGFMAAVRIEYATANNYNNLVKTRNLTEGAFSDAMNRVAQATPPLSTTKTWVSAPGVVYTISNGVWMAHRLFSYPSSYLGAPPTRDWMLHRMNINNKAWVTGVNSDYEAMTISYPPPESVTNVNTPAKWPGVAATNSSIWAGWENIDTNGWISGVLSNAGYTNIVYNPPQSGYLLRRDANPVAYHSEYATRTTGMKFQVLTNTVKITALGVLDKGQNGISGPVQVGLYSKPDDWSCQAVPSTLMTISSSDASVYYDSTGYFLMKNLATPAVLSNGTYGVMTDKPDPGGYYAKQGFVGASDLPPNMMWIGNINRDSGFACPWNNGSNPKFIATTLQYETESYYQTNIVADVFITNALAGRFTYWMDDEACKVNLNEAKYRDPSAINTSQMTDIDLRGLEPPFGVGIDSVAMANILDAFHQAAPYATLDEARLGFDPVMAHADFQRNKFYTTVNSKEPNKDAFGRDRIDITDVSSPPTSGDAYNQFTDDLWSTMLYSNALQGATIRNTFLKKYGNFGVQQILANIIDYQKSGGTAPTMSTPLGSSATGQAGIPDYYAGLKKGPMLESIIVQVATNQQISGIAPDVTTNVDVRLYIHPKLVNGYDADSAAGYTVDADFDWTVDYVDTNGTAQAITMTGKSWSLSPLPSITSNSFYLARTPDTAVGNVFTNLPGTTNEVLAPQINVPMVTNVSVSLKRVRLLRSPAADSDIVDWMALTDFTNSFPNGMRFNAVAGDGRGDIVTTNVFPAAFTNNTDAGFKPIAIGKQDPRVRTFPGWTANTANFGGVAGSSNVVVGTVTTVVWYQASGPNFQTNWWVYAGSQINPLADDDVSTNYTSRLSPELWGLVADTRPAAGTNTTFSSHRYLGAVIKESAITTVGELSDIHTGYPWRTIRFRSVVPETTTDPNQYNVADPQLAAPYTGVGDPNTGLETVETSAIADWVMLDMFQVGSSTDPVVGRMNINQRLDVAGSGYLLNPARTLKQRVTPIKALLANTTPDLYSTNAVVISGTPSTNFTKYLYSSTNTATYGNPSYWIGYHGRTCGYKFDVLEPITVEALGLADADKDNLSWGDYDNGFYCTGSYVTQAWVRVCDSSGNEVVPRVHFNVGNPGPAYPRDPSGNYIVSNVPPVTLSPGTYYLGTIGITPWWNVPFTASGASPGVINASPALYMSPDCKAGAGSPDASGVLSQYAGTMNGFVATLMYSYTSAGNTEVATQGTTSSGLDLLANNIARRSLQSQSPYAANPLFATPGEVCEVTGMGYSSSSNSVAGIPNQFERQRIIRRISNLITTRSHAFSYWGMGELIKDVDSDGVFDYTYYTPMTFVPANASVANTVAAGMSFYITTNGILTDGDGTGGAGDDLILGRARYNAIIERYEESGSTKVRALYNRYYADPLE